MGDQLVDVLGEMEREANHDIFLEMDQGEP